MNIEQQLTNISDVIFYENLHLQELKKVKTPFHIIQAKEANIKKYIEQEKDLKDLYDKQQQFKDINGYISLIRELEKENENLRYTNNRLYKLVGDLEKKSYNIEELQNENINLIDTNNHLYKLVDDLEKEIENSDIVDLEEELDELLVKIYKLEKSNKEKDDIINSYKEQIYDLQEQICGLEERFWGSEEI